MNATKIIAPFVLFLLFAAAGVAAAPDAATTTSLPLGTGSGVVIIADIDNRVIGPITAEYVETMIAKAKQRNAECLVFRLDTPGGLLESTKRIVGDMLNADVPIVVWVAPSGARAASAGMFITMAGHVAVMAPGTHIGAAHPVNIGGEEKQEKEDEFVKELRRYINEELKRKQRDDQNKNVFRPIPDDHNGEQDAGEYGDEVETLPLEEETTKTAKRKPGSSDDGLPVYPETTGSAMGDKILNDTVAWAHNIASMRGRNGKWAELAVRASVSATEDEALKLNVIDFVAASQTDLLDKLHDRTVILPDDKHLRLNTRNAAVELHPMSLRLKILDIVVHPQIALVLMSIGMIGIFIELTSPGIGVPGIAGAILFIIGLYAMSVLPVNYAGLLLLAIAIGLFVADAKVGSHGLLSLGGGICMVLGMLMLIRDPAPFTGQIPLTFIIPVTLATAGITIGLVTLVLRSRRVQVATGAEGMTGDRGVAITDINPRGRVEVGSETWSAVSDQPIRKGEKIVVTSVSGLTCTVKKAE